MIPPADDQELKAQKLEEERERVPLFHCGLHDADIVHKIAEEFLPGLASACVDNTTGGLFRSPTSVAVDIRREMVDYLIHRSENFVAESVVLDTGLSAPISDEPYDIISDFIDDFASSKRNFFSRVSGWLLSERREDRIDDFVQEMEMSGFWLLARRESVAQTLLKSVDVKRLYYCTMNFRSPQELDDHIPNCGFRTMICPNEGCNATFSVAQNENHDSTCQFKILKCEQNCQDFVMRRDMDRHCITVCSMKLVKCPFYSIGCHISIPHCEIDQHRSENLNCHLIFVLQFFHKEASAEDLNKRVEELTELCSPGKLAAARDGRSLTSVVRDLEAKLGPLKVQTTSNKSDEPRESIEGKEEDSIDVSSEEHLKTKMEIAKAPPDGSDHIHLSHDNENLVEPTSSSSDSESNTKSVDLSISMQENLKEPPLEKKEATALTNAEVQIENPSEENAAKVVESRHLMSPMKAEEQEYSCANKEKHGDSNADSEGPSKSSQESDELSPAKRENSLDALDKVEESLIKRSPEGKMAEPVDELGKLGSHILC